MRLAEQAGFPPGVINVVTGDGEAGAALVDHPDVAQDLLHRQRRRPAARSPAVPRARLRRLTLELGGKSPNIVFADADLDAAEAGILAGIFAAAGQTCVAGSRALVQRPIHDELLERVAPRAATSALGDPMDDATQMGPIANPPQLDRVSRMVDERARGQGATSSAAASAAASTGFPDGLFYGRRSLDRGRQRRAASRRRRSSARC